MSKKILLAAVVLGLVGGTAYADENVYYSGTSVCLDLNPMRHIIVVKEQEGAFEYYSSENGNSYRGTKFPGNLDLAGYDYSRTQGIEITNVSDESITLFMKKNGKRHDFCQEAVLKKRMKPIDMYSDLYELASSGNFDAETAQKIYEIGRNIIPSSFIPTMEQT